MMIRGKNIKLLLMVDGERKETLAKTHSAEVNYLFETESQEYLGQEMSETELSFNGADITTDIHFGSPAFQDLMIVFVRIAKSATPGEQVDVSGDFTFPDGSVRAEIYPNVKPSAASMSAAGSKQRVNGRLTLHSDEVLFPDAG